jgi:hypothetical protein
VAKEKKIRNIEGKEKKRKQMEISRTKTKRTKEMLKYSVQNEV